MNHLSSEWEHKWIRKYGLLEAKCFSSAWHISKKEPELLVQVYNSSYVEGWGRDFSSSWPACAIDKVQGHLDNQHRETPTLKQEVKRGLGIYRSVIRHLV